MFQKRQLKSSVKMHSMVKNKATATKVGAEWKKHGIWASIIPPTPGEKQLWASWCGGSACLLHFQHSHGAGEEVAPVTEPQNGNTLGPSMEPRHVLKAAPAPRWAPKPACSLTGILRVPRLTSATKIKHMRKQLAKQKKAFSILESLQSAQIFSSLAPQRTVNSFKVTNN